MSKIEFPEKRLIKPERFYVIKVLFDLFLLSAAVLSVFFLHYRGWDQLQGYSRFFLFSLAAWLLTTLISQKFKSSNDQNYLSYINHYLWPDIILVALVSLGTYLFGWYHYSRFVLFGGIGLFIALELVWVSFFHIRGRGRKQPRQTAFSAYFFLAELILSIVVFAAVYFFKRGSLDLAEEYILLFMGVAAVWMIVSLLTHRFQVPGQTDFLSVFSRFWKSEFLILGICSTAILLLRFSHLSRFIVLGSLLGFALMENLIAAILFFFVQARIAPESETMDLSEDLVMGERLKEEEKEAALSFIPEAKYNIPDVSRNSRFLRQKLQKVYLKKFDEVYRFIEESVDLGKFDIISSVFFYARSTMNVEILEDESLTFLFNLEKVNEFRRINRMFVEINRKLKPGGVYIGSFESLEQRKERIFRKFPKIIAILFYPVDFIYKRIMPKLPVAKKIYFFLSRGHNRALSNTECLGRLYYCGFEIVALQQIEGRFYFVARKAREPMQGYTPSYGMFFKQKRIGRGGKIIEIFKLRTMHPYAEFMHQFIYERHRLEESGKIKRDFRVTSWGRFFRRTWLDEMPMLINWIRGDLKLVGVRPLSETFFATYPEDLKRERIRYKPGLIPPYYADMPGNIEEVWESERRYLARYAKKPLRTDAAYFFKAMKNILFHQARSS